MVKRINLKGPAELLIFHSDDVVETGGYLPDEWQAWLDEDTERRQALIACEQPATVIGVGKSRGGGPQLYTMSSRDVQDVDITIVQKSLIDEEEEGIDNSLPPFFSMIKKVFSQKRDRIVEKPYASLFVGTGQPVVVKLWQWRKKIDVREFNQGGRD